MERGRDGEAEEKIGEREIERIRFIKINIIFG